MQRNFTQSFKPTQTNVFGETRYAVDPFIGKPMMHTLGQTRYSWELGLNDMPDLFVRQLNRSECYSKDLASVSHGKRTLVKISGVFPEPSTPIPGWDWGAVARRI